MRVIVCERETEERECVCVFNSGREHMCEREKLQMSERDRVRESVCEYKSLREREREGVNPFS